VPVYIRNDVDPDRFFGGEIGRVLKAGDEVDHPDNPDWQYFDEAPFGTVITPPDPPPVAEEPVSTEPAA
jgi:hypothetical protein